MVPSISVTLSTQSRRDAEWVVAISWVSSLLKLEPHLLLRWVDVNFTLG